MGSKIAWITGVVCAVIFTAYMVHGAAVEDRVAAEADKYTQNVLAEVHPGYRMRMTQRESPRDGQFYWVFWQTAEELSSNPANVTILGCIGVPQQNEAQKLFDSIKHFSSVGRSRTRIFAYLGEGTASETEGLRVATEFENEMEGILAKVM